jgi:hypothetical protein
MVFLFILEGIVEDQEQRRNENSLSPQVARQGKDQEVDIYQNSNRPKCP